MVSDHYWIERGDKIDAEGRGGCPSKREELLSTIHSQGRVGTRFEGN